MCGFGHYGARFALGDACYEAARTQKPWFDRQMQRERERLQKFIRDALDKWPAEYVVAVDRGELATTVQTYLADIKKLKQIPV